MCGLRQMSIPYLVSGHIQKLGKKMDIRKGTVEKWKHGVGERIEKNLTSTLERIGFVVNVEMYSRSLGKYSAK